MFDSRQCYKCCGKGGIASEHQEYAIETCPKCDGKGWLDMMLEVEFKPFPKIARLNREVIATEKIDGTNASIYISDDLKIFLTGSRTKWITPEKDNFGFSRWAHENREELLKLGPGTHFGEWWGHGIQRGYGLKNGDKRFSLFNVSKWSDPASRPACCGCVPELARGNDIREVTEKALQTLREHGTFLDVPPFYKPEGIVLFHTAGSHLYKVTLENDESPKGLVA